MNNLIYVGSLTLCLHIVVPFLSYEVKGLFGIFRIPFGSASSLLWKKEYDDFELYHIQYFLFQEVW